MTPAQSKAARAVLEWSVSELARRSRLPQTLITSFEQGGHLNPAPRAQLIACFETAGIELRRDGYGVSWVEIGEQVNEAHGRSDMRRQFVAVAGKVE